MFCKIIEKCLAFEPWCSLKRFPMHKVNTEIYKTDRAGALCQDFADK